MNLNVERNVCKLDQTMSILLAHLFASAGNLSLQQELLQGIRTGSTFYGSSVYKHIIPYLSCMIELSDIDNLIISQEVIRVLSNISLFRSILILKIIIKHLNFLLSVTQQKSFSCDSTSNKQIMHDIWTNLLSIICNLAKNDKMAQVVCFLYKEKFNYF